MASHRNIWPGCLALAAGWAASGCSGDGGNPPGGCGVPAAFAWSSTGAILAPASDGTHDLVSIKDPSVVYYDDKWHVFVSTVDANGSYSMAYLTFPDWDHTADATFSSLDQTPALRGYHAAPQIFFFAPQSKWYLVFQSGPPQCSTNDDIENPAGWTAPQSFFAAEPIFRAASASRSSCSATTRTRPASTRRPTSTA